MQTAAIPYRVADFLKQYPPFHFMEESELIALAARGRVRFHESDEYICWQSSPHTPYIYVIQQGSVSLWDESVNPPKLCDLRGAGDSIGIERFNGVRASLHSAKAASDVILYALDAADLEPLLAKNLHAARYVAAYSSVTPGYTAPSERANPHEMFLADLVRGRDPVLCTASTPIREAARILCESGGQALALTDGAGPCALLTSAELLLWIAEGAVDPEQPASNIARAATITVGPQTSVSDCVLAMAESHAGAAVLTTDGSPRTPLQTIVTASSLVPAFGDHPITILQEIGAAPNVESLRLLNMRARAWILDSLTVPPVLDWLASWADRVNRRILERLLQLTGQHHVEQLWCFYGAAGRQELLTSTAPRLAVMGAAHESLHTALAECGYVSPEPPISGDLDDWKARFSRWIRDPISSQVYRSRALFDLRPVYGSGSRLFRELESHIRDEFAAEPVFLRVLANDCLSSLPPLTFFRDLVVEESGEQTDTFRLQDSALEPLADVARVFSLAAGSALGASTSNRFDQACRLLPLQESLFGEAAEAMRVLLFYQARAGLRGGTSGAELPLNILSRHDRQILKSVFRSIHTLLEFTASCDWLKML